MKRTSMTSSNATAKRPWDSLRPASSSSSTTRYLSCLNLRTVGNSDCNTAIVVVVRGKNVRARVAVEAVEHIITLAIPAHPQ